MNFRGLGVFVLGGLCVVSAPGQDASTLLTRVPSIATGTPLLRLGAPMPGLLQNAGERVESAQLQTGAYAGRGLLVDCLPFRLDETPDHESLYWAFPTDETGFGWDEDHPIRLLADHPLELSSERSRIRALCTVEPATAGPPLFRIVVGYAHDPAERVPLGRGVPSELPH